MMNFNGQENEEEQTQQPVHEHAFGEAWVQEELIHYHMCECGEKGEATFVKVPSNNLS